MIALAVVNLVFSLMRAHGKLLWTLIFAISGWTLIGIVSWSGTMNPRASIWFTQIGNFCACFSLILLA